MTETVHIGSKFHVYPGEMKLFNKIFDRFDVDQLSPDEQELFWSLQDSVKDFVLTHS